MFAAEITLNPIETDEGLLVSSAIRDVTDRKRADELTARLAAIVNSTPNAIIGVGSDGRIETLERRRRRTSTDYTPEEAIGQPITILNPPERVDDRVAPRRRAGRRDRPFRERGHRAAASGSRRR